MGGKLISNRDTYGYLEVPNEQSSILAVCEIPVVGFFFLSNWINCLCNCDLSLGVEMRLIVINMERT